MRDLKEISEDLIKNKITINQARTELGYPELPEGNRKLSLANNEQFAHNLFKELKGRLNGETQPSRF